MTQPIVCSDGPIPMLLGLTFRIGSLMAEKVDYREKESILRSRIAAVFKREKIKLCLSLECVNKCFRMIVDWMIVTCNQKPRYWEKSHDEVNGRKHK